MTADKRILTLRLAWFLEFMAAGVGVGIGCLMLFRTGYSYEGTIMAAIFFMIAVTELCRIPMVMALFSSPLWAKPILIIGLAVFSIGTFDTVWQGFQQGFTHQSRKIETVSAQINAKKAELDGTSVAIPEHLLDQITALDDEIEQSSIRLGELQRGLESEIRQADKRYKECLSAGKNCISFKKHEARKVGYREEAQPKIDAARIRLDRLVADKKTLLPDWREFSDPAEMARLSKEIASLNGQLQFALQDSQFHRIALRFSNFIDELGIAGKTINEKANLVMNVVAVIMGSIVAFAGSFLAFVYCVTEPTTKNRPTLKNALRGMLIRLRRRHSVVKTIEVAKEVEVPVEVEVVKTEFVDREVEIIKEVPRQIINNEKVVYRLVPVEKGASQKEIEAALKNHARAVEKEAKRSERHFDLVKFEPDLAANDQVTKTTKAKAAG